MGEDIPKSINPFEPLLQNQRPGVTLHMKVGPTAPLGRDKNIS